MNYKKQTIQSHNNNYKFSNFKNLFTFRSFTILSVTLIISFCCRSFIIVFFNLNYTLFNDFFIVGIIISVIRPLVTDLFDVFFVIDLMDDYFDGLYKSKKLDQYNRQQSNVRSSHHRNQNNYYNSETAKDKKYIIKRKFF